MYIIDRLPLGLYLKRAKVLAYQVVEKNKELKVQYEGQNRTQVFGRVKMKVVGIEIRQDSKAS